MTKETAIRNASQEIQLKAQEISGSPTLEEAKEEFDRGCGYLCALYDTDIFDRDTFETGADVLRAAYREAEKRAALGAGNTEGGKHHNSIFSIAMIPDDVKCCGLDLYRLICSMQASRVSDDSIVNTLLNVFRPRRGDAHAE